MAILRKRRSKKSSGQAKDGLVNRKIDPRLRLLGNCDFSVCNVRAQTDPALRVQSILSIVQDRREIPNMAYAAQNYSFSTADIGSLESDAEIKNRQNRVKGSLYEPTDKALVSVFITYSATIEGLSTKTHVRRNLSLIHI